MGTEDITLQQLASLCYVSGISLKCVGNDIEFYADQPEDFDSADYTKMIVTKIKIENSNTILAITKRK